ncbi:MAG: ATP-dependent helicase [Planctomycetes bacterium]|nr:ATP-dependent helicase [Planctomycetota bacterium]
MSLRELQARLKAARSARESADRVLEPPATVVGTAPRPLAATSVHETADQEARDRLAPVVADDPQLAESFERLDPWQRQAVATDETVVCVEAQVGSGKTTVLVTRVLYLARGRGIPLRQMAILTFSNQAAAEIRARLIAALPEATAEDLRLAGTFHGVARALLAHDLDLEGTGFSRDFRVLGDDDRRAMLEMIIDRERLVLKYRRRLDHRLRRFRDDGQVLSGSMKRADDLPRLAELYDEEKRRQGRMDFDDLISLATDRLPSLDPERAPRVIVVDEFQDSDPSQIRFIEALRSRGTEVFVVGDPHQLVYSWRGSQVEVFDLFRTTMGGTTIRLPRNYRSTEAILIAARGVMGGRCGSLVGARDEGRKIRLRYHHDPTQEAMHVAQSIARRLEEGVSAADLAVLFRVREQGTPLAQALERLEIPHHQPQRSRFGSPLLRWLRALFAIWLDPGDLDEALRFLRDARFGLPRGALPPMSRWKNARRTGRVRDLDSLHAFLAETANPGVDRVDALRLVDDLRKLALSTQGDHLRDAATLIDFLELARLVKPTSASFDENLAIVHRVFEAVLDRRPASEFMMRLREVHDALALGRIPGSSESSTRSNGVALLTLHASKGLEFSEVFIVGVNEGLVPLASSLASDSALAEERRLLFVGMTRARDELELSWLADPRRPGAQAVRSRFLDGIATDLLDDGDGDATPTEAASDEIGATVQHRRYGEGVIVAATTQSLTCTFARVGTKTFRREFL